MNRLWILFTVLLISCEGDQFVRYRINGLDLLPIQAATTEPQVLTNEYCDVDVFGLRFDLMSEETHRKGRYFDYYESSVTCDNSIKQLKIYSNVDFDSSHPAGSSLNEYFYYFPGDYTHVEGLLNDTIAPYITAKYMPNYIDQNFPKYADFLLTKRPDNNTTRKFFARIELRDGTVHIDSTITLNLVP
jgi:hypothetical protein